MGQVRTAIVFGAAIGGDLPQDFWETWGEDETAPGYTDSDVMYFPVAVAYEEDGRGTEIRFPVAIDKIGDDYAAELNAAREKWEAWRLFMKQRHGIVIPAGALLLDEVERR